MDSFQKKEPYTKYNWPRNISTVPTDHTIRLSTYTYALKQDRLKKCDWYLPCLTPIEISNKFHLFCQTHEKVDETDHDKFDGRISRWIRLNVEHPIYHRHFRREFSKELGDLLARELGAPGRTKNGVKYEPECSRLSGSPLTTDGNTIINAFVGYCCGRMRGMTPVQAWQEIGLCYGDDGLS